MKSQSSSTEVLETSLELVHKLLMQIGDLLLGRFAPSRACGGDLPESFRVANEEIQDCSPQRFSLDMFQVYFSNTNSTQRYGFYASLDQYTSLCNGVNLESPTKNQISQSECEQCSEFQPCGPSGRNDVFFATTNLLQYEGGRRPVSLQQNDSVESIPFWRACKPSISPTVNQWCGKREVLPPTLQAGIQPACA